MQQPIPNAAVLLFIVFVVILLPALLGGTGYTGVPRRKAVLILVLSALASLFTGIWKIMEMSRGFGKYSPGSTAFSIVAMSALIILATAFIVRMWNGWVGGNLTEAEREPGRAGVAAWFSTGNVLVGLGLVLTSWLACDVSPLMSAVVVGGILAAYPLTNSTSNAPAASVPPPADDLSSEREKILSMLEAGKLTPEESNQLLQALGETSRAARQAPVPLDSSQRLLLTGAALVLLGFFLPWLAINPGKIATNMMADMSAMLPMEMLAQANPMQEMSVKTPTVYIAGGDIKRGLGWMALIMAIAAAALPYLTSALDAQTLRTVRLLSLGIGAIIVLYLASQNLRFVSVGLILTMAGYALAITGAFRDQRARSI